MTFKKKKKLVLPGILLVPNGSAFRENFPKLNCKVSLVGGGEFQAQSDQGFSEWTICCLSFQFQLQIEKSFCKFSVDTILNFKFSLSTG